MSTFLLLMILITSTEVDTINLDEKQIYVYEYAVKKPKQVSFGFAIIDSNNINNQAITIIMSYSKNKITIIEKEIIAINNYSKNTDGNITIDNLHIRGYTTMNFAKKKRYIPDSVYRLILIDFFEINNKERLKRILSSH